MNDTEALFSENVRLASWVVVKQFPQFAADEDFHQEAQIGLWKASKAFDPNKKVKFASFAVTCIRNACLMAIRRNSRYARLSVVSFDELLPGTENITFADTIPDHSIGDLLGERAIREAFFMLPKRERKIIEYIVEGRNQAEIGQELGISQSYVSRIVRSARQKLECELGK
jgi:RNA polymerase sporulation-specific sigma factor